MNKLRNRVQLIGFLGSDPELKSLDSGNTLAKFSIATNDVFKDAQGEKVTITTWHACVAWNKLGELCGKILKKGREVVIDGKLVYRNYEDTAGLKRFITEIQVNEILLVGSKGKTEEIENIETDDELASI